MSRVPYTAKTDAPYTLAGVTRSKTAGRCVAAQEIEEPALSALTTNTWENFGPRRLAGNPTTGEVGWASKFSVPNISRRTRELLAVSVGTNVATVPFTGIGWEESPTVIGTASVNKVNAGCFVQFQTGTVDGDVAGFRTARTMFRYKWDQSMRVIYRTTNYFNARIWIAWSNINLNGISDPSGANDRVFGFRLDTTALGNWFAVSWNGSTLVETDTGLQAEASAQYGFGIDYDNVADKMRYSLYNWSTAADLGVVAEHTFAPADSEEFGLEFLIEKTSGGSAQSFRCARVVMQHDG